jgi:uncharacterized protein
VQPFLTANWRYLAMLNYVVDPRLLAPLIPRGTEIDFQNGETFLSVVGFLFLDTRLLGLPVPVHRDFEEVNLRFYVRRKSADTWRRGVVFVRDALQSILQQQWLEHKRQNPAVPTSVISSEVENGAAGKP